MNHILRALVTLLFLVIVFGSSYCFGSRYGLSTLGISAGTLSPAFYVGTFNYTCSEIYAVSSVMVTPTAASTGTIQVMVNNGSDYLNSNGKIGGTSSINSNGKLTPAGG